MNSENRPNLVYVFADQLRYRSVGYNGDPAALTPHIDALARESVNLDNAVSNHPVCAPYRASLFTGKYTTKTGMVINEIRINPNHITFADRLNENGYDSCYIGKWHMYANKLGDHYNPKNSYIPKGRDRLGFNGYFAGYNFHHEYYAPRAYYHLDSEEKIFVEGYEPDCQTDMAISRIRDMSSSGRPFALFLSLGTPHDPWTPENVPSEYHDLFKEADFPLPPNYREKNDRYADMWARFRRGERKQLNSWMRAYYAMTANLDWNIGRLAGAIRELGLEENTIFVFTSDHGEMFGAQGRRAKNIFYEEAVRVPFLIRWKNRLERRTCSGCFSTVDIMPSLLSLMEIPVPETVEGTDLSGMIRGETEEGDRGSLLMGTGPTARYGDGKEWRAFRTGRYTYAVYRKDRKELLFDNLEDPFQTRNLAESPGYGAIKEELKSLLQERMKSIGDNFEKNNYYRKHWIRDRIILEELK